MIEVLDPEDAFPDYSRQIALCVRRNRRVLRERNITFRHLRRNLLDSEDAIIAAVDELSKSAADRVIVFDITSFPKRFFGLMLKRLLLSDMFQNVVATYTYPGPAGHTAGHLAEDSMTCDHLPGFAPPYVRQPSEYILAVSVGFEPLNIRSILEIYREKQLKLLLPFPPDGESGRRVWATLRNLANNDPAQVRKEDFEVVAAWDAEHIYRVLRRWRSDANGLNLAPFGPKPHSLGMFLFAIEDDCGMFYTQPKAYNPNYSIGVGETWAYVVKWDGIPCFNRTEDAK